MSLRIVFVTGGTSGYGKAIAHNGDQVMTAARHPETLERESREPGCDTVCMDVT